MTRTGTDYKSNNNMIEETGKVKEPQRCQRAPRIYRTQDQSPKMRKMVNIVSLIIPDLIEFYLKLKFIDILNLLECLTAQGSCT